MNLADIQIVEAHEALGRETARIPILTVPTTVALTPAFDLERDMWRRGRFAPSLFADSGARSFEWRQQALAGVLPWLPQTSANGIFPDEFFRALALGNAREEHGLQQRSGLKNADFSRILQLGVQSGVWMRLRRWAPLGERSDDPAKLYWIDPGLLHAMLGWSDEIFGNKIAGLSAGQPTPERDKQILHNSWEGFVITSLVRCVGNSARPTVWRSPTGEIDLILTWLGGEDVWAIEVTMGSDVHP